MESIRPKVFIQSNFKQRVGALISQFSLVTSSLRSSEFDTEIMMVEDQQSLMSRHKTRYLRNGSWDVWDREDLQSFTMTRFMPPQRMNFKGRALVIDPDVFATPGTDVMELLTRDMAGHAVLACSAGAGKYKSSVMLLDCSKLRHWDWPKMVEDVFQGKRDYRQWMSLELEPPGAVGVLEDCWNHCDNLDHTTKLIHYTRRLTQPWKTGLKVDFHYDTGSRFPFIPRRLMRGINRFLKRGNEYHQTYQPNPFPEQEKFFFSLVNNALEKGLLSAQTIDDSIQKGFLRKDFKSAARLER